VIVLGIETAGPQGSVALWLDAGRVDQVEFASSGRLGAELAPAIKRLLAAHGLGADTPPDLVAVDVGPGSYTGLRIGIAAAKGLAFAWSRPLVGVSAVDALRTMAPPFEQVVCALDASRGEVYAASFRRAGDRVREERAPGLCDPRSLGAALAGPAVVVGDAAPALADPDRGIVVADPAVAWPTAAQIAALGRRQYLEGVRQDPLYLAPTYYRPNEAEEQRRKRSMKGQ